MGRFQGKRALITGAGSGIGQRLALDLAAAGAEVAICGRRHRPLEETSRLAGGGIEMYPADLTDADDAFRLAEAVGPVDILVNNAGFSSLVRSARHIGPEEWCAVMNVNTLGPAMLTRALLPTMIKKGAGDVVTVSSVAAISPSIMAGAAYSAAKAAVRAWMDVLAAEVQRYGIRCITVLPGEVDTPILDRRARPPDSAARAAMMMPEDVSTAIVMALALPRRATMSEIVMVATQPRDLTEDIRAAMEKTS
ncbi:MAG: SDR family NAD(P)-dependent oxidoreductase [Alphaproteobacteria bacterium]|nr:SDR family NAD(P)-dependent oxidoreductase [Alphaproteobacteria bacterium]MCY4319966.1 SDR family NAD(P)-dependent oxidoreductase [Alphaproteobacteria bacterium]